MGINFAGGEIKRDQWHKIVEKNVDCIANRLAEEFFSYGLRSVLWTGGFARGEYSFVDVDGRLMPYGDYDFYVIADKTIPSQEISRISGQIHQELELDINLDVSVMLYKNLAILSPDLSSFDLKAAKVVWGEDILKHIRISAADVPLISPFRIIFNRLMVILIPLHASMFSNPPPAHVATDLHMLCDKLYLDSAVGLLHKFGYYQPGMLLRDRLSALRGIDGKFTDLLDYTPYLLERISNAIESKLNPTQDSGEKIVQRCVKAFEDGQLVLKYIIKDEFQPLSLDTPPEDFANIILEDFPSYYYAGFLAHNLSTTFNLKVMNRAVLTVLSWLAGFYENLFWRGHTGYFAGLCQREGLISPILVCMASALYLMSSASKGFDSTGIGASRDLTTMFLGTSNKNISDPATAWDNERERLNVIWYLYTRRHSKRNLKGALGELFRSVFSKRSDITVIGNEVGRKKK